jgi:hypothetical protein
MTQYTVTYYDVRLYEHKTEAGLTRAEASARANDLSMMELGGHVSDILITINADSGQI